jgi:hypothetical protein
MVRFKEHKSAWKRLEFIREYRRVELAKAQRRHDRREAARIAHLALLREGVRS